MDSAVQLRIEAQQAITSVTKHISYDDKYDSFCVKGYSTKGISDQHDQTTRTAIDMINYSATAYDTQNYSPKNISLFSIID